MMIETLLSLIITDFQLFVNRLRQNIDENTEQDGSKSGIGVPDCKSRFYLIEYG